MKSRDKPLQIGEETKGEEKEKSVEMGVLAEEFPWVLGRRSACPGPPLAMPAIPMPIPIPKPSPQRVLCNGVWFVHFSLLLAAQKNIFLFACVSFSFTFSATPKLVLSHKIPFYKLWILLDHFKWFAREAGTFFSTPRPHPCRPAPGRQPRWRQSLQDT